MNQISVTCRGKTQVIPVKWLRDIVLCGGADEPGVVVSADSLRGFYLTTDQRSFVAECIQYNVNEGNSWEETACDDALDDDDFCPPFSWRWVGGERQFNADKGTAWNAPSFRDMA